MKFWWVFRSPLQQAVIFADEKPPSLSACFALFHSLTNSLSSVYCNIDLDNFLETLSFLVPKLQLYFSEHHSRFSTLLLVLHSSLWLTQGRLSLFCINSIVLIWLPFIVWVCSFNIFIIFSTFSIRLKSLLNLRVKTLF